jgi:hypothetical protein
MTGIGFFLSVQRLHEIAEVRWMKKLTLYRKGKTSRLGIFKLTDC